MKKDSDEEDSWNLVTCFCMKPYYGRAMIECTQCKTWLHMSCAKIRPNNVPDVFKCNLCRKTKGSKRRSARIRGDRSRFLA
ncbi:PHD finger protein 13 [Caerostris extrusa]|uniref:PHD finger protein 13 n=1 Tax=Caerostris extrusa TaxID=172846 RepID=A0AAV4S3Q6_CAEEX|nr:PHD finger protein 13 [Caerostris extrusa]